MDWKRIDELSSRHRAKIITVVAVSGTLALFIVGRELLGSRRQSHKTPRPRAVNPGGGAGGGGGGSGARGYYDHHTFLRPPPPRNVPILSSNPPACWTGFRAAPPEPGASEGLVKRLRIWLRCGGKLHCGDLGFLAALLGLCVYACLSRRPKYTYTYTFYPPFYQQEPQFWF